MNPTETNNLSRRELGKRVGQIAAASALAGVAVPYVHAAGDSTIQVALVGCGGRGTGAAGDALHNKVIPCARVTTDSCRNIFSKCSRYLSHHLVCTSVTITS